MLLLGPFLPQRQMQRKFEMTALGLIQESFNVGGKSSLTSKGKILQGWQVLPSQVKPWDAASRSQSGFQIWRRCWPTAEARTLQFLGTSGERPVGAGRGQPQLYSSASLHRYVVTVSYVCFPLSKPVSL